MFVNWACNNITCVRVGTDDMLVGTDDMAVCHKCGKFFVAILCKYLKGLFSNFL